MKTAQTYAPLTTSELPVRLGSVEAVTRQVGGPPETWKVREVGDGNLNLVFIVEGLSGAVVVKQALPYVRLVGDSWPLALSRAFYEYHALVRQAARDPGRVPSVLHFDETQAMIVMEYLAPHRILRRKLIDGERVTRLGEVLGLFCARTAFHGSELGMASPDKKADVALFSGNIEIPAITESLVFTDPYFAARMNRHTPHLESVVGSLRGHAELIAAVQRMLMRFTSSTETMIHGDLHSGSIMATAEDVRIIDPEFVQYGPMGFDIGMLTANFLMAYFSQPAHRGDDLVTYQDWILSVIESVFESFEKEFMQLWRTQRRGILFPRSVLEDQVHDSSPACFALLADIFRDAMSFCGIEMHRRCLSLAHNADFEEISDERLRASLEARNLLMGAELILHANSIPDAKRLTRLARAFNERDVL